MFFFFNVVNLLSVQKYTSHSGLFPVSFEFRLKASWETQGSVPGPEKARKPEHHVGGRGREGRWCRSAFQMLKPGKS